MHRIRSPFNHLREIRNAVRPDLSWVSENKKRLMERVVASTHQEQMPYREPWAFSVSIVDRMATVGRIFISPRIVYAFKPSFTVFMAVIIATSGWIASVHASFNSLPGDVLWSVKLATEKTQMAMSNLSQPKEVSAQLHIKFAHRRAQEFKKVIEQDAPNSAENASTAIQHLKESLESADQSLREAGQENPEKMADIVKEVSDATGEISKTLKESSESPEGVKVSLAKEVAETNKVATEISLNVAEVVLSEEETTISEEIKTQVKMIVEEKINQVIGDAEADAKNARAFADKIQEKEIFGINATSSIAYQQLLTVSNTILAPIVMISSTEYIVHSTSTAQEVIQQVGADSTSVHNNAEQVQSFLKSDQLLEAIQKTKQLNQAVEQMNRVVSDVEKIGVLNGSIQTDRTSKFVQ